MDEYPKIVKNEDSDNPAGFDQLKAETIDYLRKSEAWVCCAFTGDDHMHLLIGASPGIGVAGMVSVSIAELIKLLERMAEEVDSAASDET